MSIFYTATDGAGRIRLYRAADDGSGAVLVPDRYSGNGGFYTPGLEPLSGIQRSITAGGKLFFMAGAPTDARADTRDYQPWVIDGQSGNATYLGNTGIKGTSNAFMGTLGNLAFFRAQDSTRGIELFVTDGTASGTRLVADLLVGSGSSNPSGGFVLNGRFLFNASSPSNVTSLYSTDGTTAGTRLVEASGVSGDVTVFGEKGYFLSGARPWITDGTPEGTFQLSTSSVAARNGPTVQLNGRVLIGGYTTDGTVSGTSSLNTGAGLTVVGNKAVFIRPGSNVSSDVGFELGVTNGTAAGTTLLKDINVGPEDSEIREITAVNGRAVFSANTAENGRELWVTDGTAAGTVLLREFIAGDASGDPSGFVVSGGRVFFTALTDSGRELWSTDGTAAGTIMALDVNTVGASSPANVTAVPGGVTFTAYSPVTGREAYYSDGTAAGTRLIRDAFTGSTSGIVDGTGFFSDFNAGSSVAIETLSVNGHTLLTGRFPGVEREPFVLTASGSGVAVLKDINAGDGNSNFGLGVTSFKSSTIGNQLYFHAVDEQSGAELWVTDGTSAGTRLVKDINPGVGGSTRDTGGGTLSLAPFGAGMLAFQAYNPAAGTEIWVTDGTEAGTILLDIVAGPNTSQPSRPYANGSQFFFGTINGLVASNGTVAGTQVIAPVFLNDLGAVPVSVGGKLYFKGATADGSEPWVTDGTAAGTFRLADIVAGSGSGDPRDFFVTPNGRVLFSATSTTAGTEVWSTDGTVSGTSLLKDILPGTPSGFRGSTFTNFGGATFFVAETDTIGTRRLFVSDGTTAGTVRFKPEGNTGAISDDAANVTVVGARLLYTLPFNSNTGITLATSDGTYAGTTRLTTNTGAALQSVGFQKVIEGGARMLFTASDGTGVGQKWFISDGTSAGTRSIATFSADPNTPPPFAPIDADLSNAFLYIGGTPTTGGQVLAVNVTPGGGLVRLTNITLPNSGGGTGFISVAGTNAAPVLGGLGALGTVGDHGTIALFAGSTVTDADTPAQVLTIKLTKAAASDGAFTPASLAASGFAVSPQGGLTFTGTAAASQAALRALVFEPSNYVAGAGASAQVGFTIEARDPLVATTGAATLAVTGTDDTPTTPDLAEASDTGRSVQDNITSVRTPTIAGRADAGTTVSLLDGGTVIATQTAAAGGFYSFAPTLTEGGHALTTRSGAGLTSAAQTVVIDVTGPLVSGGGITMVHNSSVVVLPPSLSAADNLSGAGAVVYTVVAKPDGVFFIDGQQVFDPISFTQTQMDERRVAYGHIGQTLSASVTLDVSDTAGNVTRRVLPITLTNAAPVANPDSYTVTGSTTLQVSDRAQALFGNDTDSDAFDQSRLQISSLRPGTDGPITQAPRGAVTVTGTYGVLQIGALGQFTYDPTESATQNLTSRQTDLFTYEVKDNYGGFASATVSFLVGPPGSVPALSGFETVATNDKTPFNPFANVTVADTNTPAETITLRIALGTAPNIRISNLGGGTLVNERDYTVSGTAAEVTAIVRAIVGTPIENQLRPGLTAPSGAAVSASNRFGQATGGQMFQSNARFDILSVNDAPTLADDLVSVAQRLSVSGDVHTNNTELDVSDPGTVASIAYGGGAAVAVTGAAGVSLRGAYGVLLMRPDGNYTYTADSEGLPVGASVQEVFDIEVRDIAGAGGIERLRITVNGSSNGDGGDNRLLGSGGDDTLDGGAGNDGLAGGAGNDSLSGGEGDDLLVGNGGDDTVSGGVGGDYLVGDDGQDLLLGGSGADELHGGEGDDLMGGGEDGDVLTGDDGDDRLYAEAGDDYVSGGAGSDLVDGGDGSDLLLGDGGDDALIGGGGGDGLVGEAGRDYLDGGEGADVLIGGADNDYLVGGADADYLQGDEGDDLLYGGSGGDQLHGGAGRDVLGGETGGDALIGGDGDDLIYGGEDDDFLSGGTGRDEIYGGTGSDILIGGDDADILVGEDGSDMLFGAAGADLLVGGAGGDIFRYLSASDSGPEALDIIADFESGVDWLDLNGLRTGGADVLTLQNIDDYSTVSVDQGGDGVIDFLVRVNGSITAADIGFFG